MVYLLKDLRLNKYLFKINKKKSILNQNFFIKELKYFYKIKNKKLLENFKKNNNGLEFANKRSFLLDEVIDKCYKEYVIHFDKNINSNVL